MNKLFLHNIINESIENVRYKKMICESLRNNEFNAFIKDDKLILTKDGNEVFSAPTNVSSETMAKTLLDFFGVSLEYDESNTINNGGVNININTQVSKYITKFYGLNISDIKLEEIDINNDKGYNIVYDGTKIGELMILERMPDFSPKWYGTMNLYGDKVMTYNKNDEQSALNDLLERIYNRNFEK